MKLELSSLDLPGGEGTKQANTVRTKRQLLFRLTETLRLRATPYFVSSQPTTEHAAARKKPFCLSLEHVMVLPGPWC